MTALIPVERALELAAAHVVAEVIERIRAQGRDAVRDGWPDGVYRASDEPVWTITVPSDSLRVGGIRVLCISKTTGRVVFDGAVGE